MGTIARVLLFSGALGAVCSAQQWEIGGNTGAGFLNNVPVTAPAGSATAGFKTGPALGGFIGHNTYKHLSGEFHYNYLPGDLKISSGGSEVTFKGMSHAIHYDFVFHTARKNSKTQLFAAIGGGGKMFQGTGTETAYQPLNQYGYLTKTHEFKPMLSVGAGVKVAITPRIFLRTEFRDYITGFPKQLIAPAPGARFSGVLQDIVPMVGLSFVL